MDIMDIMDIRDIMDIMDIMDNMDIMDIMNIMNIMIKTAWMAMAGAVSALVFFFPHAEFVIRVMNSYCSFKLNISANFLHWYIYFCIGNKLANLFITS